VAQDILGKLLNETIVAFDKPLCEITK